MQDPADRDRYNQGMSEETIILAPGAGRAYDLGPMRGVFKADGPETGDRYCVSEWSVEPGGEGPGPHHHEANEELFLVTEGTMSFRVADDWIDAPAGTFIRIPAGVTHDFANRSGEPATAFNVFIPGGFEAPFRGWVRAAAAQPSGS
jgi:mannose-6-phosphate isomerase-like protein (cupin superfamily)